MMSRGISLNAYFKRIGYEGDRTATLDTLRRLHELHPQALAFENLNPLLRIPVLLDTESLVQKLVQNKRGGYCFEQNLLFKAVLEALGFNVKGLAARILWNVPEGRITPRSHMLLLVEVEGNPYIADVGFGGLTLTAPLQLEPDTVQETPHEPFRLHQAGDQYIIKSKIRNEWKPLCRFGLEEVFLPDYEVSNWYLSNNPESHFVTGLIAARTEPGRRYALRNNKLSVHHLNGETDQTTLTSAAEIRKVLKDVFLLEPPEVDQLEIALEQLVSPEGVVS